MNYNNNFKLNQVVITDANNDEGCLIIPTTLKGFINTETNFDKDFKDAYTFKGYLCDYGNHQCEYCGKKMIINNTLELTLKHLNIGANKSYIVVKRKQYYCENCNVTKIQDVPFKADNHNITIQMETYIKDLLATGNFNNKEIEFITGVNRNIVKDIDKKRLLELYTVDGKKLIKPEEQALFLGIDEFKLHKGYKYATHIINLENGHILWIEEGKKKKIVYNFMKHVGDEWMKNVLAVACDMNSDFSEAFTDKYPHIMVVFDYFHIVKNFNEFVVSKIYKEKQRDLRKEGKIEEADSLKKSKYILTSSKETLEKKDEDARKGKVIKKGSELFNTEDYIRKEGYLKKYNSIIESNEIFLLLDVIKEKLKVAYRTGDTNQMIIEINEIIKLCNTNGDEHLLWFSKLLSSHYDGIISHSKFHISSGKIEGINNKIKTLRRQAYGYHDDEYFFLKLLDISRVK